MTSLLAVESEGEYVDLPMPTENGYQTVLHEEVIANRNTVRNLYKYRINTKQTIAVEWDLLTPKEKNLVTSLTGGNSFHVRYFDTEDSTFKYGKFYRGSDYQITPQIRYNRAQEEFMYYNIKMTMGEFRCTRCPQAMTLSRRAT